MNTQKLSLQLLLLTISFFCFSSLFAQTDFPKEVQDWMWKGDIEDLRPSNNKSYIYQNEYGEKYKVYFRFPTSRKKEGDFNNPISIRISRYSEERKLPDWKVIYYMDFDGNLVFINYETNYQEYANFRQEIVVKEGQEWYHKISKKEKGAKQFEAQSVAKGAIQDEIGFPYFLTKTEMINFLKPKLVAEANLFKPLFMQRESNFIYSSELPKSVNIKGDSKEYSFGNFEEEEELERHIRVEYKAETEKTVVSGMLTPFDGFSFEVEGYVSLIGLKGKYVVLEGTGVDSSFEIMVYSEEKSSVVFNKWVSGLYFYNKNLIFSTQASEKQIKNAIHYGECEEGGGMSIEKHGIYDAGKLDDLSTDDIPIHFTNQVRCILVQ